MWRHCLVEARKHRLTCIFKNSTDSSKHVSVWLRAACQRLFQRYRKLTYNQRQSIRVKANNNPTRFPIRSLASCKVTLEWPCSLSNCLASGTVLTWCISSLYDIKQLLHLLAPAGCATHTWSPKPPILPNQFWLWCHERPQKYEFDILSSSYYKQFKCRQKIKGIKKVSTGISGLSDWLGWGDADACGVNWGWVVTNSRKEECRVWHLHSRTHCVWNDKLTHLCTVAPS